MDLCTDVIRAQVLVFPLFLSRANNKTAMLNLLTDQTKTLPHLQTPSSGGRKATSQKWKRHFCITQEEEKL